MRKSVQFSYVFMPNGPCPPLFVELVYRATSVSRSLAKGQQRLLWQETGRNLLRGKKEFMQDLLDHLGHWFMRLMTDDTSAHLPDFNGKRKVEED